MDRRWKKEGGQETVRRSLMRWPGIGLLLLLVVATSGCLAGRPVETPEPDPLQALLTPPSWPASATRDAPSIDLTLLAREIHTQVNAVREQHALPPLAWTSRLEPVAQAHSQDMATNAFFGHVNPRGENPNDRARNTGFIDQVQVGDYLIVGIGENLFLTHHFWAYHILQQEDGARHYLFDWKTPQEIARQTVESWMQSLTHRANLLSPLYQAEAIGIVRTAGEALFITQNLACRADDALAHAPPAR